MVPFSIIFVGEFCVTIYNMNKNLYHPNDKTFTDGENLVYIADLPAHLMHTDVPKNVALYQSQALQAPLQSEQRRLNHKWH